MAKKKFSEFAGCENEWRSSIHRMLEIFASIPPSKWHDPSIYTRHGDEVYSKNRLNSAVGVKWKGNPDATDSFEYIQDFLKKTNTQFFEITPNLAEIKGPNGKYLEIRVCAFERKGRARFPLPDAQVRYINEGRFKLSSITYCGLGDVPGLEFILKSGTKKQMVRIVAEDIKADRYLVFRSDSPSAISRVANKRVESFRPAIDEIMRAFTAEDETTPSEQVKAVHWTGKPDSKDPLLFLHSFFQYARAAIGIEDVLEDDSFTLSAGYKFTICAATVPRCLSITVNADWSREAQAFFKRCSFGKQSLTDIGVKLGDSDLDEDIFLDLTYDILNPKEEYSIAISKREGRWKISTYNNSRATFNDFATPITRLINCFLKGKECPEFTTLESNAAPLERVVSVLFTDVEAADINARLRGGSMPSVPRLSIGPTKIPSPGQKNVEDDELVINGAPLLVERLSSLGVMKPNEAEALVARKLENYFVHNSGFQLSREKALEILEKLRGTKAEVRCAT